MGVGSEKKRGVQGCERAIFSANNYVDCSIFKVVF